MEQSILRETTEEIGLDISHLSDSIEYLYSFKEKHVFDEGTFIDNEFYDVFVLKSDFLLKK